MRFDNVKDTQAYEQFPNMPHYGIFLRKQFIQIPMLPMKQMEIC